MSMFSNLFKISLFLFIGLAIPLHVSHSTESCNHPPVNKPFDPSCAVNLAKKYLKLYTEEGDASGSEQTSKLTLKSECETYKAEAAECCGNPNSCTGFMKDLTTHLLPLTPAMYQTVNAYKASKDIASEDITPQEASRKMCGVQNNTSLAIFGSQLLTQTTNAFQTTCSDRIKECQSKCNGEIENFKEEFRKCFKDHVHTDYKESLERIVAFAKKCADIDNITDANGPSFDTQSNLDNEFASVNLDPNKCIITEATVASPASETCTIPETRAIGYILLFAKAYLQSSIDKKHNLNDRSNEEEIVKCSHQPKRVVTGRAGANQPIPTPMIDLCERFVEDTLVARKLPPLPSTNPNSLQSGNLDNTSNLGGSTRLKPPDDDDGTKQGIVDDTIPDENNPPSLSEKVAGWSASGSGGPSGGSPSGGGPAGGASAPDISGSGVPSFESYRSPSSLDDLGMFSGGEYMPAGGWEERPGAGGVQLASNDKDGTGLGEPYDFPEENEDENTNKDNIFSSASQRIQLFCSDYDCSSP